MTKNFGKGILFAAAVAAASAFMAINPATVSAAENTWVEVDGAWVCYDENNEIVAIEYNAETVAQPAEAVAEVEAVEAPVEVVETPVEETVEVAPAVEETPVEEVVEEVKAVETEETAAPAAENKTVEAEVIENIAEAAPAVENTVVETEVKADKTAADETIQVSVATVKTETKVVKGKEYEIKAKDANGNYITENASVETVVGHYEADKEDKIVALTNEARADRGLSALTRNADLDAAAQLRAAELTIEYSHQRPDERLGKGVTACTTVAVQAENIAKGYTSAEKVVTAWTNSPAHYGAMVNDNYTKIGVAFFSVKQEDGLYYTYQVQLFA